MNSPLLRKSLSALALLAVAACAGDRTTGLGNEIPEGSVNTGGSTTQPVGDLSLSPDSPTQVETGVAVTIGGNGFVTPASANTVIVDGTPVQVTAATANALTVVLPADAFACGPVRQVSLTVNSGGRSASRTVMLRTARAASLAAGQSALLADGQRCLELPTAGSRYLVSVTNAGRTASAVAPFELRGTVSGQWAPNAAPALTGSLASTAAGAFSGDRFGRVTATASADDEVQQRRAKLHDRLLASTRGMRARYGRPGSSRTAAARVSASPTAGAPVVAAAPTTGLRAAGDTATLRIPDINASNACGKFFTVKTRVVATTPHAILLEDTAAPLAGQMDATYQSIAQEFETLMWPILTANFGNPLALDGQLDRNGKLVMLFSPVVNNNFPGIAGFVIGCDFFPRTQAASSNEGEVFYATVPTSLTGAINSNASRDGWRRTMRSTIIHEAKHITAYAERLAQNADIEEAWLEEGTARHAEELYARALTAGTWNANAGYGAISCEVRPTVSGCTDRPYVMFKHFDGLWDYLAAGGALSPLGQTATGDYNYYASAWALVRWAADLAPSEASFFRALTRGPVTGVANLEQVTGRSWGDIVADWTLSLALDDYAGFSPARAQRIGSWNLQDVFAGMYRDFPSTYGKAHPLTLSAAKFGAFAVTVPSLRGGSGSMLELTGAWQGPQILELRLPGGGRPANTLRLAVTRVQ